MLRSSSIEDQYALSPMQQGMLFYTLYDRQEGLYVDHAIFDFPDHPLNVDAFRRAWESVVARHASLRTSFHWEGLDAPVQRVHTSVALPFQVEDWRRLSPDEQSARFETYVSADRRRGFTMSVAPLTRVALLRLGQSQYRCVWTIHHLLADGRSAIVILREVFALYDSFSHGRDLELPPARRYREYIDWLERQDRRAAEAFWRRVLHGFTAPTPLVIDRPIDPGSDQGRQAGRDSREADRAPSHATASEPDIRFQEICVQPGTTAMLERQAARHLLSVNTFVEGAWALVLSRYCGEDDVVFGEVRAARRGTVEDADAIVGVFMNTIPVRVRLSQDAPLLPWLKGLRLQQVPVLKYEHTPLVDVQRWSELPPRTSLFDSILDFTDFSLNATLRGLGPQWEKSTLHIREKTNYALMVYVTADPELRLKIGYDPRRFDDDAIARLLGHLSTVLEGMAANPDRRLHDIPLLTQAEQQRLLIDWNNTAVDYPREVCVHQLFEAQVARTPNATAVCFEDRKLTYRELNARANQAARYLTTVVGVRPGDSVGICLHRSLDMMVALLAVLKAGAAYVPLDPTYPKDRLDFILDDAGVAALVTEERLATTIGDFSKATMCLDSEWPAISQAPDLDLESRISSDDLAYVMYTSGSTGKPKGVKVRHRNIVNFFAGMDDKVDIGRPGVWLAVTSISFDISVLELFWALSRGFKVVLQRSDEGMSAVRVMPPRSAPAGNPSRKPAEFSLFYFASNDTSDDQDKYRLLLEGARFADAHGFCAVWTPERHFHPFGGLYPNPSVTSAALAAVTRRIHLRAGSVVLPLQHPIRVAEEWAVVDNLSAGRVGVSFASGWHVNDFALAPEKFAERKAITFRDVETVRRLWRGESVTLEDGAGHAIDVHVYPRPIQRELPVWITAAGDPETFRVAGEMGANLLTHLLGTSVEALAERIAIYRKAWRDHGHTRGEGVVTLMLHTFVGESLDRVRETVRPPLMNYLRSASDLARRLASSLEQDRALAELSETEMDDLHERAFERFFSTSGLLGTPETCLSTIERLEGIGVDEIACLIDFGVDADSVMTSLRLLDRVRQTSRPSARVRSDDSIPAQIAAHGVTHFQCTPSMARMLAVHPESLAALKPLRKMLLGGEALPADLAHQLSRVVSGDVLNMYGPTETTVWSTTGTVDGGSRSVTIGRPIANTQIYILDRCMRPVPIGVPGELYIGGDGVTAGYHNRPDLTVERFVENPFSTSSRDRLYRTGDVARYRADGTIDFLGRVDHQVKIRGHRIELEEIEAVLQQHPGVREAVVVAREDHPGDQRLVAYVVADASTAPDDLRDHTKTKLPKDMVPAAVVLLAALPRTPNGKLDRRALPAPESARAERPLQFVAPRTTVEKELTALWEKVLRVHPIGLTDNFFELGGHSLLAVVLFTQIEKTFGKNLPLATLFEGPTVEQLARILEDDEHVPAWSPLVAIQPHGSRPPLFFMHAEGGNVLEYYPLARRLGPNQPFYGLQSDMLNGQNRGATPRVEDLAARYIREIRTVQPTGPYFLGGWCLGGTIAFEVAQQLCTQGEEVALLALVHTAAPEYPRFRSDVTFVHRFLYRTLNRMDLEWSNAKALEPKARLSHLLARMKRPLQIAQLKAERLVDPWLRRLNLGDRHSVGYTLQAVGKLHVQAVMQYACKPYPGDSVALFRANKQSLHIVPDQTLGWGTVLNGKLEVHDVCAHRENIMIEPAVGSLATQLNACIERACRKYADVSPLAGKRAS